MTIGFALKTTCDCSLPIESSLIIIISYFANKITGKQGIEHTGCMLSVVAVLVK